MASSACRAEDSDVGVSRTLRLNALDDVIIAKVSLAAGTWVETEDGPVKLREDIAAGHKIAFRSRAAGEAVRRYGQIIGVAAAPICAGDHVHTHNVRRGEVEHDYRAGCDARPVVLHPPEAMRTFEGYARPGGRVGTRNYVAVVSTVNCAASVARFVSERFRDVSRDYPGVDGVVALTHRGGCGHIADGEDHLLLERVLAGYARHPNVAAYVIVGLGCEVAQPETLIARQGLAVAGRPPPVISIQSVGGTRKAVEATAAEIARLLPRAAASRRSRQPVSRLVLGTNCGGSDGYSGITANPALGWASDELIRYGGTAVLGETTEIYGAEQLLVQRAANGAVAKRLLDLVADWRRQLVAHGGDIDHNPSPGNVAGGITTVLEKSLGGISKGGTTPLVEVVEYGERIEAKGLVFMNTPAYDPVSVTGMVAGGANVLAFTTGRGSVFGSKPVPSLKLATSSELYRRMEDDMDVDCGAVLDGVSLEQMGRQIFEELIELASGRKTKSELLGVGEEEFEPWFPGLTV